MPAEWEPQAAVWLQWPAWEGDRFEQTVADIVEVLVDHENAELVVDSAEVEASARRALEGVDLSRVTFHEIATDSSWMRDNGPRYLEVDGELILQNWEFDGWGSRNGLELYADDSAVPDALGELLGREVEQVDLIHERGDLEVNGRDTAIVSRSVLSDRDPDLSKDELTALLQEALGVTSVIYTEGYHPLDITKGHVDGMVRFISEDTVIVAQDGSQLMDDVAEQIASQRPDLEMRRMVAFVSSVVSPHQVKERPSDPMEPCAVASRGNRTPWEESCPRSFTSSSRCSPPGLWAVPEATRRTTPPRIAPRWTRIRTACRLARTATTRTPLWGRRSPRSATRSTMTATAWWTTRTRTSSMVPAWRSTRPGSTPASTRGPTPERTPTPTPSPSPSPRAPRRVRPYLHRCSARRTAGVPRPRCPAPPA